jgi:broad specificity phosphatase PhoE
MSIYENYLRDLGDLLREIAQAAKQNHEQTGTDFTAGYLSGLHRTVSLMQQQAEAFGIPLEKIKLDGIDPDQDLV